MAYNCEEERKALEEKYLAEANLRLSNKEFGLAADYYRKVLEINEKNHRAHWGIVLSEHQVTDERVFSSNVTLEADVHCYLAISCAEGEDKQKYISCYVKQTVCALLNFITYKAKNDFYLMKKWGQHYQNSQCADEEIKKAIDIIIKGERLSEFDPLIPGAFLVICGKTEALAGYSSEETAKKVEAAAWAEYEKYMGKIKTYIINKDESVFNKVKIDPFKPVSSKRICEIVKSTFGLGLCEKEKASSPSLFRDLDYYKRAVESSRLEMEGLGIKLYTKDEIANKKVIEEAIVEKDVKNEIAAWINPKKAIWEECGIDVTVNVDKDSRLNTPAARYLHLVYLLCEKKDFYEEHYLKAKAEKPTEKELEEFWGKIEALADKRKALYAFVSKYHGETPKCVRNLLYVKTNSFKFEEIKMDERYVNRTQPLNVDEICVLNYCYIDCCNKIERLLSIEEEVKRMLGKAGEYQEECTKKWNEYAGRLREAKKHFDDVYMRTKAVHMENYAAAHRKNVFKKMFTAKKQGEIPHEETLFMDVTEPAWTEVKLGTQSWNNCVVTECNVTVGAFVKKGDILYRTTLGNGIAPKDGVVAAIAYRANESMGACRPACYIK